MVRQGQKGSSKLNMDRINCSEFLKSGYLYPLLENDLFRLGWGFQSRSSEPSHDGSIYAPDFFLKDPNPWWNFQYGGCFSRLEILAALADTEQALPLPEFSWLGPSRETFQVIFEDLQSQIKAGRLKKAVPISFDQAEYSMTEKVRTGLLRNLLHSTLRQPLFPYGVWSSPENTGGGEGILGATPEILFLEKQTGVFETVALAGTRLNQSVGCSLWDDPKERKEHQIVIEGICRSLEEYSEVIVGETGELALALFTHLRTPIEFNPKIDLNSTFQTWVRQLHPTPALGAFPRDVGWEWLHSLEKQVPRSRFGAPVGYFRKGQLSTCLVAIRNLQWVKDRVFLGAGCGVVEESQFQKEWAEVRAKMDSVRKLFGF